MTVMALQIPTVTVDDLRAFHTKHFPHVPAPEHILHGVDLEASEEYYEEEDDGLGYYPDGVKRTLTDEQIAMFRHSEIQAIIRKRRLRREDGEISEDESAPASPHIDVDSPDSLLMDSDIPAATGQPAVTVAKRTHTVQAGRIEKPKLQQWATSSARTKSRNKKHNHNYRRKKKEEKKRRAAMGDDNDEDDESDEWDPWHQANGPDVQKDETLDLDY